MRGISLQPQVSSKFTEKICRKIRGSEFPKILETILVALRKYLPLHSPSQFLEVDRQPKQHC